jgi:3-deoxy-manno-octulosonate cytidylyltransferase (CMP-KDO synthetase)
MKKIAAIIPARYGSSRFPGKVLADIAGKSMVERVYEQAQKAQSLAEVYVATDHQAVFDHVEKFGGKVVMTSTAHPSGTDRCLEAYSKLDAQYDYIINIQGDEPFIHPEQIDELSSMLEGETQIATLGLKATRLEQVLDVSEVKIATDIHSNALYFSRSVIPFPARIPQNQWLEQFEFLLHVGIYGYRIDVLEAICKLKPSSLELTESLEQLRWIENGFTLKVGHTKYESKCIETPEDLEKMLIELNTKAKSAQ